MHEQTLYPQTRQTIKLIGELPLLQDFYLAGGTNLALQLGHRKSIDLDFFTPAYPGHAAIHQALAPFNPQTTQEATGTLDLIINETKVSFLEYDYPLLHEDFAMFENLRLAQVEDVACMKLTSIMSRGARKDFVDLYFILKHYSLQQLFELAQKKYAKINYSQSLMLRSLDYFTDTDQDLMPEMLADVSWEQMKQSIHEQVVAYSREQLA